MSLQKQRVRLPYPSGLGELGDHRTMCLFWRLAICLTAVSMAAPARAVDAPSRSVLVLDQSDISGPLFHRIFEGILDAFNSTSNAPVTVYFESLDFSRFSGADYEQSLERHFLTKYRDKKIGVVLPIGDAALKFSMK